MNCGWMFLLLGHDAGRRARNADSRDSSGEKGEVEHRCDFVLIDKAKGSATAYIAKYVSKSIDGEHIGDDLESKSAIKSAKRVEAWCATWGTRQFQSIGCPPVGVWRELRRIPSLPADAPEHLQRAHRAANKQVQREGDERETVAWEAYCRAQGGMGIGREAAIKLAMRAPSDLGRYVDAMQPRPLGVEAVGAAAPNADLRTWVVESVRHIWSIERPQVHNRRFDWRSQIAETAQPASPRTRVNNCTHRRTGRSAVDSGSLGALSAALESHDSTSAAGDRPRQPSWVSATTKKTGDLHGRLERPAACGPVSGVPQGEG